MSIKTLEAVRVRLGYNYVDLWYISITISAWFNGISGMQGVVKTQSAQKRWQSMVSELSAVGRYYGVRLPSVAYRMANVLAESAKLGTHNMVIGPRPVLSFSRDPNYPRKFYKTFYRDLNRRKDKRFAYVVIKTEVTPKNYVTTTEACINFLIDLKDNYGWLASKVKEEETRLRIDKYSISASLKRLQSRFILEQQEVILSFASPKISCEVVEILHAKVEAYTFTIKAAQRLLAYEVHVADSTIDQHREEDELQTQEFMQQQASEQDLEVEAADTLRSRDPRDVVPYMFAHLLAASFRERSQQVHAQQDAPQTQLDHPENQDIEVLTEGAMDVDSAMGDNIAETDPLHQEYEGSNPRYLQSEARGTSEASSTSDTPFDNFDSKPTPNLMYLEDQPDTLMASTLGTSLQLLATKHKKKKKPSKLKSPSKLKKHTRTKHPHKKSLVDKLLDEDSLMYRNEASAEDTTVDITENPFNVSTGGQKFTYDSDDQPGSVRVRFPVSPGPTDGSSYMYADSLVEAGFNDEQQEQPETLGEPSEVGEVQILSAEDTAQEQEVLGDADAKSLWNVAQQPLS